MAAQFWGRLNFSIPRRLLFLLVATLLRFLVATLRASTKVVGVTKLSTSAREEVLACVVHFLGKGELLAVQNQSISVLLQLLLSPLALILTPICITLRVSKCLMIFFNLSINVVRLIIDFSSGMLNMGTDIAHVVGRVAYSCLECFESYHNLSLHLDSLLVVTLIPDFFVFIKVVDLFIKVSTWEILRRSLRVIWLLVSRSDVEAWLSSVSSSTILLLLVG